MYKILLEVVLARYLFSIRAFWAYWIFLSYVIVRNNDSRVVLVNIIELGKVALKKLFEFELLDCKMFERRIKRL